MKDLKIFTDNIEPKALNQIYELIDRPPFENAQIRIMPDVHSGKGCVVGFTSTTNDKIIPNVVGVDIGCGMLTVKLGKCELDFEKIDNYIKRNIPAGTNIHKEYKNVDVIKKLKCFNYLDNIDRLYRSLGTLGGGNHFIEIDVDDEKNYYLVVHTGSRNLGQQVANYYQKQAIEMCKNASLSQKEAARLELLKSGRVSEIPDVLRKISMQHYDSTKIPAHQCHLWGEKRDSYLYDIDICQQFAQANRCHIVDSILAFTGIRANEKFDTFHNYIDNDGIVRKGAVSAHNGQKVIIPMNMRDGCIIAEGKGNPDWNFSAPHGAGRLHSRKTVKEHFTVEEFEDVMRGVYSTTVGNSTLDESPMAYKPMKEIVSLISPTVDIKKIIRPVYNFKSGG